MKVPHCELTIDTNGRYYAYMDLPIVRNESIFEVVRCWGSLFPYSAAAKQDAARTAIQRLRDELDLQIKDANYEDRVF